MYEKAIITLQTYIDEYLFEPGSNWPTDEFAKRSYSMWIADEIMHRFLIESERLPAHITNKERLTPIEILEELICDLDYYSGRSYYGKFQNIFNIAKETAIDISRLFL